MQDKDANINVIRTVWRRTKKGHIKVRDLQPEKDVKGGGGVAGIMRMPNSVAEAPLQLPHKGPLAAGETPRASWLHQLRASGRAARCEIHNQYARMRMHARMKELNEEKCFHGHSHAASTPCECPAA